FVIRKRARREIKLRIDSEQRKRLRFPRLMAERLKLRNQTNVQLPAQLRKLARALARDRIGSTPEFGMRLEREVVINFENDDVDSLLRQRRQCLSERLERGVGVAVEQVHR